MPLERAWWRKVRVEVAATPPEMAWGLGPDRHQIGPHSRFFGVGSGYSTTLPPTEGMEPIRGGTSPDGAP